jgi:ribonuclease BN (tRNA processing enzyme)
MLTKLTFLGAGSAFSYDHGQTNAILSIDEGNSYHNMLIDCGTQWHDMIKKATGKKAFEYLPEINSIFVTHLHADHVGGLEEIMFLCRFIPGLGKKKIYGKAPVVKDLWDKVLRGGGESLDYGQLTEEEEDGLISLKSYFKPSYLADNDKIKIANTTIEPFDTVHVTNRMGTKDSSGLFITTFSGKKIMYTGDTQFAPNQMMFKYEKADHIFQDCETAPYPSKVHAHYNDLKTLPEEVKAKMCLMHYNDGDNPDCVKDGFAGWVEQGQEFKFV